MQETARLARPKLLAREWNRCEELASLALKLLQRLVIMGTLARRLLLASALGVVTAACGDDGEAPPGGGGGSGGGGNETTAVECSGEFARVMDPYTPNTTIEDWGGFVADEQGLVFSVIQNAMSYAETDVEAYPQLILKSDLSGNMETLYTSDEIIGQIFVHGDDVYFVDGLLSRAIYRVPRAGGEAVQVTDTRLWAGPVPSGELFYYAARPNFDSSASLGDAAIYSLDPATGTSTLLSDQGDTTISAITVDGGTIYWVEVGDILSETEPYALWSMPAAGGEPEMIMTIPNGTAIGNFRVVGEVAYGNTLGAGFTSVEIHRIPFGGTPEVVEDRGGFPMLIAGESIYYGAISGLTRNSLEFDSPSVIEGTSGKSIYSLAMGPTDLWYSTGPCIYRLPQ